MSNPERSRPHDPKAFTLSLTREGSNVLCAFALPGSELIINIYELYNDPLKNLLRVARSLHLASPPQGYDYERLLAFEWDCEGVNYIWRYRPLHGVPFFRLHVSRQDWAASSLVVDTVLDCRVFAKQVWREALGLLRAYGYAGYHPNALNQEFPLGDFFLLHHIVTGEPRPKNLREEIMLLTRLSLDSTT